MLSGRPAGAAGQHKALFQIPGQGHDGRKDRQRGGLAPQDAGAKAHRSGTGLCGHLGFLSGKAALGSGVTMAILRLNVKKALREAEVK